MCGCGKAYLSYPALYTHVKNKHDGVFPIGSNAKRKIPKNVEEDCDHLFIPNVSRFFEDFEQFISQIDNASSENRQSMKNSDIDHLFGLIGVKDDINAQFFKSAMKAMLQLENDKEKFERLKESLNINQVLAFYLISAFPYCSYEFFREYFILTYMIIRAINDKGEMFIDKAEKHKITAKTDDNPLSESIDVHITAEILNLFIAELFPHYLKTIKEDRNVEFKYLGFEDENIKNLILMCKYTANWLFNHEFTEYRLEINVDF